MPWHHQPPAHLALIAGRRYVLEELLPRARIDPVGGHDQVIVGRVPVAESDGRATLIRFDCVGGDPEHQAGLQREQAIRQDLVQHWAKNSAGAGDAAKRPGARVDRKHQRAVGAADVDSVSDIALPHDGIEDSEALHGAQRRAGDGYSCTVDPPLRVALAKIHGKSGLAQRDSRRHAGDAASYDKR
jgi:hypothetical protein